MVFERFTERTIKAVMAAQNEARAMGRPEVTTDELLLGPTPASRSTGLARSSKLSGAAATSARA